MDYWVPPGRLGRSLDNKVSSPILSFYSFAINLFSFIPSITLLIKPGAVTARASAVAVLPTTVSIAASPARLAPAFCSVENRLPTVGTGSSDCHLAAKDPETMFSVFMLSVPLILTSSDFCGEPSDGQDFGQSRDGKGGSSNDNDDASGFTWMIFNPDFDLFKNEPDFVGEFVDLLLELLFEFFESRLAVIRGGHSDCDRSLVEDKVDKVRV